METTAKPTPSLVTKIDDFLDRFVLGVNASGYLDNMYSHFTSQGKYGSWWCCLIRKKTEKHPPRKLSIYISGEYSPELQIRYCVSGELKELNLPRTNDSDWLRNLENICFDWVSELELEGYDGMANENNDTQ